MAKSLTSTGQGQLDRGDIKLKFILTIKGIDRSNYLLNWNLSYSQEFGSASATFTLDNNNGVFGENGSYKIEVGDVISFSEKFGGDTVTYPKFYGTVNQRSINKTPSSRTIELVCLDYISTLQFLDVDMEVEGDKVEIINETLTPNYLTSPNESLSQIFNFSRDSIAPNPRPIITIKNKNTSAEDPTYDGFEIYYDNGQIKMGFPINALDNYDVMATSYYYYTRGLECEDILEDLLTESDGYGSYLFGEATAQAVIDNHLTDTFLNVEGVSIDYLQPNYTSSSITIYVQLASAVLAGASTINLDSTDGLPESGEASINGDIFTWTSKGSNNSLEGISSILNHNIDDYVKYTADYSAGRVWYLKYNNLVTDLIASNFTIPTGVFSYLDKRQGRIILESSIDTSQTVSCNVSYSFKTLQATGITLNAISFRQRELQNRLEAVKKLKNYLAPNYIIRTIGDNKIWASYLTQKTNEDYTLQLATGVNYLEDEDLYTRVMFFGKNKNPTNLMFDDSVDFIATGASYKSISTMIELGLLREEDNYWVYGPYIGTNTTSEGYLTCSRWTDTIENDTSIGTIAWTNPTFATFDDNDFTTASGTGITNYLKFSGFNLELPADSTIKGIIIGIKRKSSGAVVDERISLLINGVVCTVNKATTTAWTTTSQYIYYGASNDLWGETLTVSNVGNANFGIVISANITSGIAYIDAVTMSIIYDSEYVTLITSNHGLGRITANTIKPIIYLNGVVIDNTSHLIAGQSVATQLTTRTDTTVESGGKGG